MKKLMIAAAIVCATVAAQAAQFDWKTAASKGAVNAPEAGALVGGTAYIFESTAASTILAAFAEGNDWTAGALDSSSITSAGKIAVKDDKFEYGGSGVAATLNAIFAFTQKIDGTDYLYISTVATAEGEAVGSKTLQFKEAGVSAAVLDVTGGYKGAGWYAAVPEPTSGLLLLLGMAGLALKRKRA